VLGRFAFCASVDFILQRSAWRPNHVIEETKTRASKATVPVIPILAKYLEAHRNGSPSDGFIFTSAKTGRPLDRHNLANRVVRPALKKKNVAWCGWHGFRRGLATTLYALGVDGKTRQSIPARKHHNHREHLHEAGFRSIQGGYGEG
jgi:integrase